MTPSRRAPASTVPPRPQAKGQSADTHWHRLFTDDQYTERGMIAANYAGLPGHMQHKSKMLELERKAKEEDTKQENLCPLCGKDVRFFCDCRAGDKDYDRPLPEVRRLAALCLPSACPRRRLRGVRRGGRTRDSASPTLSSRASDMTLATRPSCSRSPSRSRDRTQAGARNDEYMKTACFVEAERAKGKPPHNANNTRRSGHATTASLFLRPDTARVRMCAPRVRLQSTQLNINLPRSCARPGRFSSLARVSGPRVTWSSARGLRPEWQRQQSRHRHPRRTPARSADRPGLADCARGSGV